MSSRVIFAEKDSDQAISGVSTPALPSAAASTITLTNNNPRRGRHSRSYSNANSSREPSQDRASMRKWRVSMAESMDTFYAAPFFNRSMENLKASHRYISHELNPKWMTTILILSFFTSGLIDSVAFNSWNCFVGMQTGNTVFVALGVAGLPKAAHFRQYWKSLVSIGAFCVGTLFFHILHRHPTGLFANQLPTSRRRWVLAASFIIQAVFVCSAGALILLDRVSNQPFVAGTFSSGTDANAKIKVTSYYDLTPVALLAFQAAGQVAMSRVLGVIELPTIVLSTLYHDFTSDLYGIPEIWKKSPSVSSFFFQGLQRQGKRLLAILALFSGGIVGGFIYKSTAGMAGAIWLAAAIKGFIAVSFFLWSKDVIEEGLPR